MNHNQILKHLSAKHLVQCLDEEIRIAIYKHVDLSKYFKIRWNCLLENPEISASQKNIALVAIAVLLHKYNQLNAMNQIIERAIISIDTLNAEAVLSDAFEHQSDEIKRFLLSEPIPLKRKPAFVEAVTFYRAKDVVAFEIEGKFYGAYVLEVTGINESVVLEFYDGEFDSVPSIGDLIHLPAKGCAGQTRRMRVYGMKYLPDIANQITLIDSNIELAPDSSHLQEVDGLYMMTDIYHVMRDSWVRNKM